MVLPRAARTTLFSFLTPVPGTLGIAFRYVLLKSLAKECGDNVSIHQNVLIFSFDKLELGENISIHPFGYIDATGGLVVESDVSIAHGVTLLSTTHGYSDPDVCIKDQPIIAKPTHISTDVWIGAGVRILGGVTIGQGSIIAAGAVVTKDTLPGSVSAGVPAKRVKWRAQKFETCNE